MVCLCFFFCFFSFLWSLTTCVQCTSLSLLTRLSFFFFFFFFFLLIPFSVASFLYTIIVFFTKCGTVSSFVSSTTIITCVYVVLSFGGIPVISRKVSLVFFRHILKYLRLYFHLFSGLSCLNRSL